MDKSKQMGYKHVYLETGEIQPNAMRLYEKLGFKEIGRCPAQQANIFILGKFMSVMVGMKVVKYLYSF